jgi:hypothetical protein
MRPMQDKDFDRLFQQRFETYEVEPSKSSWNKINHVLDCKKKSYFPSYWMAAASVVILTSAVLWLYRPVEVIKLHGKSQGQVALNQTNKPLQNLTNVEQELSNEPEKAVQLAAEPREKAPEISRKAGHLKISLPGKESPAQYLKTGEAKPEVMLAKQQDKVRSSSSETALQPTEIPVLLAQIEEDGANEKTQTETTKPRVKSIGGLVNFVIAQVDKRENKIIEFTDGEEGTEVSGINIGPLKFKSRNR